MRCRVSNPIPPLKRWPRFMDPCRTLSKKRIPDWDQERGKFSTISISHSLYYYYYYYFKATHTNRNTCTLFRYIDIQDVQDGTSIVYAKEKLYQLLQKILLYREATQYLPFTSGNGGIN